MQVKEILRQLDLGNSVAEFDAALENYFVETETFRLLVNDRGDIVAGDKGTGKTALYKILQQRYRTIPELAKVEVLSGFNPSGNPVFQRLVEGEVLTEGQYISIWKAYVLSLVGNWVLQIYDGEFTDNMAQLDEMLQSLSLRTADDTPNTVFSRLINLVRRLTNPKAAEVTMTFGQEGMPVITPKVEFGDEAPDEQEIRVVRHEDALRLLNTVLTESDIYVWLVLDRLDEAFQGFAQTEIPALRALFRTYLDLTEFDRIRLKLFVRKDLFRKIIYGGFVNLTHINARKIEIIWNDEDLFNLLYRRIGTSIQFMRSLGVQDKSSEEVFNTIFPDQVDYGERKPKTWSWMLLRIRDGNNVKPPRNLIDLVTKAQDAQLRKEQRDAREYIEGMPVIEPESMKKALVALSQERVEDTLLAEAGDYALFIEQFRDGKAEHNETSLSTTLGVSEEESREIIRNLMEIGFLEQIGESFKIPALYRDGLSITQGKAF